MKNEIWSWIGDLSQVAGIKHYELRSGRAKGTEAFDVRTGAGLAFTVVKDRALDIAWASYKDTALSFITPNGIVAPAFFESQGNGFLRSFYAGLLATADLATLARPVRITEKRWGYMGVWLRLQQKRWGIAQNGPTTALNLSSMAKYGKHDCSVKI